MRFTREENVFSSFFQRSAVVCLTAGICTGRLKVPKKVATSQWQRIRDKGSDAVSLFRAYAILEVPVPHDVVIQVSNITSESYSSLTGNNYLASLIRKEGNGGIIYHSILSNHILNDLSINDA